MKKDPVCQLNNTVIISVTMEANQPHWVSVNPQSTFR